MTIWEVQQDDGTSLSFHGTKPEANEAAKWWRERDNEVVVRPIKFRATKAGIAQLLTNYGGNS